MTTIYQHPDGHSIDFTGNSLTVVSSDGIAVSIPMGIHGLRQLSHHLKFTEGDCAEQAGHAIGANCLDAILAGRSQAEATTVLQAALTDLQALGHPDRAAGGFAVAMVNVIEIGLQHLPKVTA